MNFSVSDDHRFLLLGECTELEYSQLKHSLTKKVDNYHIISKKLKERGKFWDGEVKFIDRYNRVPIGLYMELQKISKRFNLQLHINGVEHFFDAAYDETDFIEWINTYFEQSEKYIPRDYQIEAASKILKFKNCVEEISTSAGKTLIVFMIFKYLLSKGVIRKMLYVVPKIDLVNQTEEKFYMYDEDCGHKPDFISKSVYGGVKKNEEESKEPNIIFGTYQSLVKMDIDFFKNVDCVVIDECHHARGDSIRNIIIKCYNTKYKFGLSGTLPREDSLDSYTIQSYLGPNVYNISSADLISVGNATPIEVIGIELDYLDIETKRQLYELRNVSANEKDGVKLLNLEKDIVRSNHKRFKFICETINKSNKNSLVLFGDVKNEYGKKIYDWLRENSERTIYYIDGGTDTNNREYYKKEMENNDDVVIVASIGVFGEGIDVKNIFSLFMVETSKSPIIVRQILGRGMRLLDNKKKFVVVDFMDNYNYGNNRYQKTNYLMRHAAERKRIYNDKKFPFKLFCVKL